MEFFGGICGFEHVPFSSSFGSQTPDRFELLINSDISSHNPLGLSTRLAKVFPFFTCLSVS